MRLVSVKCPECGARVTLPEGEARVTCDYCGTTSLARRRTRFFEVPVAPTHPTGGQMPVATQVHSARWVAFSMLIPLVIGGVIAMFSFSRIRGAQTSLEDTDAWNSGNIILHDVNGDGTLDPVGIIWYVHRDPTEVRIAAFDGTSGERLWQSKVIATDLSDQATLTLAKDTLIRATDTAKLTGYSVADGKQRWTSALPEVPRQACAGPDGAVVYVTADDARHTVSPADGTVAPAPASDVCKPIATDATRTGGPLAERRSWSIGDAYHPRYLEGMSVEFSLWPAGSDVAFAFGTRDKGTYVPNVAAFRVDTSGDEPKPVIVWKQEVPARAPLEAYASAPLNATVDGERVIVAYDMKDGVHRLGCFERADGARVWDVPMLDDGWVHGIATAGDLVYVSDSSRLDVFSVADGSHVRSIATPVY